MYLLDTAIVLELRRAKAGGADAGLTRWAGGVASQDLFISALTLLELETGVAQLERRDKPAGQHLRGWLDERAAPAFDGRILPVDAAVVRRRAQLPYADNRDGLLAATALEHGLTLVTRNAAAFKAGRVKVFDPRGYAPDALRPEVEEEEADWRQVAKTGPLWLKNLFLRS